MPCRFISTIVLMVVCPSWVMAQPYFDFFEPVAPPRSVQVMVHRGMSNAAPENSALAIEMCADDFCEWVEIDVRLSKDGHHVLVHNETVDATTNGTGRVADLTLEELKKLDAGSWFASRFAGMRLLSLREALSLAKGKINLALDCKRADAKTLVEDIQAAGMERQVVVYGGLELLAKVKLASRGAVAVMAKYRRQEDFAGLIKAVAPAVVEMDAEDVTADLCQQFHAAGIKVQAQVLGEQRDNAETWDKVITAGVDWLQTDSPAGVLFFGARRQIPQFPVMIACHRGASRYAPENTIPAIRIAAQIGADFAEIDIRTTKDGRTVLVHDGTVNRTTAGKGAVRDLLFADVNGLSAGQWFGKPFREILVPTFDEGMQQYGPRMGAYLDAKEIAPEALIAAIHKYEIVERHCVYQSLDYCKKLLQLDKSVRIMPPLKRLSDLDAISEIKPYAVDANWSILSQEMIAECHKRHIKVFSDALGPNETIEQYQKAIGWGIDCIQTDHPLKVLRAIELGRL